MKLFEIRADAGLRELGAKEQSLLVQMLLKAGIKGLRNPNNRYDQPKITMGGDVKLSFTFMKCSDIEVVRQAKEIIIARWPQAKFTTLNAGRQTYRLVVNLPTGMITQGGQSYVPDKEEILSYINKMVVANKLHLVLRKTNYLKKINSSWPELDSDVVTIIQAHKTTLIKRMLHRIKQGQSIVTDINMLKHFGIDWPELQVLGRYAVVGTIAMPDW